MIKYHFDIEQGSPEWLQLRCGIICASEMKLILTPSPKDRIQRQRKKPSVQNSPRPTHHRIRRTALHQRRHAAREK